MKSFDRLLSRPLIVGAVLFASGCATTETTETTDGTNEALSIARFVEQETATRTEVIGLDASGNEVARLALVHGQFTLSTQFAADYDTPVVDGRKLEVFIGDKRKLTYETAGYDPTLRLPAHPASEWEIAAFLEDAHVKAVLDRWQIGFQPTVADNSLDGELAYIPEDAIQGSFSGSSLTNCSGLTTCGSVQGKTINTCGGGGTPSAAWKATQSGQNQQKLAQCCSTAGTWFGIKTCPLSGSTSECGTGSGACKACPTYPAQTGYCQVYKYSSSVVKWWYLPI